MGEVTRILEQIQQGKPLAANELFAVVYDELRRIAVAMLAQEKPGQTLQATALVHEVYLRLMGDRPSPWDSRGHFFGAAAEAMRRILIDKARQKRRPKHGGQLHRLNLDEVSISIVQQADEILAIDEGLSKLAVIAPRKAELVKLKFYAGLTIPDAAEALGISEATAQRDWTYARTWLYCWLAEQTQPVQRRVAIKVIKPGMDSRRSSPASRPSDRRWP